MHASAAAPRRRPIRRFAGGLVSILAACAVACAGGEPERGPVLCGGWSEAAVTNADVVAAAGFAVRARGAALRQANPGARLALVGILAAQQQVVAGMNYRLSLRVRSDAGNEEAEAVVWWQAWNREEPYRLTSWTPRPPR